MVFVLLHLPQKYAAKTLVNSILSLQFVRLFVVVGDPDLFFLVVQPGDFGIIVPVSNVAVFVHVVLFQLPGK